MYVITYNITISNNFVWDFFKGIRNKSCYKPYRRSHELIGTVGIANPQGNMTDTKVRSKNS